jgi:glutamate 5-kinase
MSTDRVDYLQTVQTAVIKLGTQLLSDSDGRPDPEFLSRMAAQIAQLRQRGISVTLVSSGSIGAGLAELGLKGRPRDLPKLQAVAAIGQRKLMDAWATAFAPLGVNVAQILITRDDINNRARYLNLRNTIHALHGLNAIPIINENDTVSTDEIIRIKFGDNDILAALVTGALRAQLLVLLSVVDGLLDSAGQPVRLVSSIDEARALVRPDKSLRGTGGMKSKLEAARLVNAGGEAMVVADGRMENVLPRLFDAQEIGTLFLPASPKRNSRSRWIRSVQPAGAIRIDAGAASAVRRHKSLLPAGIQGAEGAFKRGDVVALIDPDGLTVAKGLVNYAADDIPKIAGQNTLKVRSLLGDAAYDEVIHCNNLVIV